MNCWKALQQRQDYKESCDKKAHLIHNRICCKQRQILGETNFPAVSTFYQKIKIKTKHLYWKNQVGNVHMRLSFRAQNGEPECLNNAKGNGNYELLAAIYSLDVNISALVQLSAGKLRKEEFKVTEADEL